MKIRRPLACVFLEAGTDLLFGCRLGGGVRGAREDRMVAASASEHDSEANRGKHEDDRGVGGELGEKVGCPTRAEGRLRTLAAKGSGEVGRFALLQEHNADDEERN